MSNHAEKKGAEALQDVKDKLALKEKEAGQLQSEVWREAVLFVCVNSYSASRNNWCTVGGNGGCRVDEVRAGSPGTTSPMPDHKGFKLQ